MPKFIIVALNIVNIDNDAAVAGIDKAFRNKVFIYGGSNSSSSTTRIRIFQNIFDIIFAGVTSDV